MYTQQNVKNELGRLPRDLTATYMQIYRIIKGEELREPIASKALMWIMLAEKPLSPEEWTEGVGWALTGLSSPHPHESITTKTLLEVCENLVIHDDMQDIIRFAHLSVREFLEGLPEFSDSKPAMMATEGCLAVLHHQVILGAEPTRENDFTSLEHDPLNFDYWYDSNPSTPEFDESLWESSTSIASVMTTAEVSHPAELPHQVAPSMHPVKTRDLTAFHKYSICYWYHHMRQCHSSDTSPELLSAIRRFIGSSQDSGPTRAYRRWFEAASTIKYILISQDHQLDPSRTVPAVIAACLGFGNICNHIWNSEAFNPNYSTDGQTLLYLASSRGHTSVVELFLDKGANINHPLHDTRVPGTFSPLLKAIDNSDIHTVRLLVEKNPLLQNKKYTNYYTRILEAAASRGVDYRRERGERWFDCSAVTCVMKLLLGLNPRRTINESVFAAATGNNAWWGKELLELLLSYDPTFNITENVLAIATSQQQNCIILKALLSGNRKVAITEKVLVAAAENWLNGERMLELLLAKDAKVTITENVFWAAVSNLQTFKQLLISTQNKPIIPESVFLRLLEDGITSELLELLLVQTKIPRISESIMTKFASYYRQKTMELLLDQNHTIDITENVVIAAAANPKNGKEVLELLLSRFSNLEITENVLIAVLVARDPEMFALLLVSTQDIPAITERLFLEIWQFYDAIPAINTIERLEIRDLVELLLVRTKALEITETILTNLARRFPKKTMELLLDQNHRLIDITEDIIFALTESYDKTFMKQLLVQQPNLVITSESVFITAAKILGYGREVMEVLLLKADPSMVITERIISAVVGELQNKSNSNNDSEEVLILLLNSSQKVIISEDSLVLIAKKYGKGVMGPMLALSPDPNTFSERVLIAAVQNQWYREEVMQLLLAWNPNAVVTSDVLIAAMYNDCVEEVVELLLANDRNIEVSSNLFETTVDWTVFHWIEPIERLLARATTSIVNTETTIINALHKYPYTKRVLKLLLTRHTQPLIITEDMVDMYMMKHYGILNNAAVGEDFLELLLHTPPNVVITKQVVNTITEGFYLDITELEQRLSTLKNVTVLQS